MGMVYADIELINADDQALARNHIIGEDEVKRMHINMLADSGAFMMCINEEIQNYLKLPFIEKRSAVMANGTVVEFDTVGPIMVKFKNRTSVCNAYVLNGNEEPLLGAIPMEEMDVLIHPSRQQLIVNPEHPDYAVLKLK
jgi:clan AA aspartic protease